MGSLPSHLTALIIRVYVFIMRGGLGMHRKLTITLADEVYRGLHQKVGRGQISSFIESLVRPHVVVDDDQESAYREMANDEVREREALEWIEAAPDETLQ
jgi:hypothetical protein